MSMWLCRVAAVMIFIDEIEFAGDCPSCRLQCHFQCLPLCQLGERGGGEGEERERGGGMSQVLVVWGGWAWLCVPPQQPLYYCNHHTWRVVVPSPNTYRFECWAREANSVEIDDRISERK